MSLVVDFEARLTKLSSQRREIIQNALLRRQNDLLKSLQWLLVKVNLVGDETVVLYLRLERQFRDLNLIRQLLHHLIDASWEVQLVNFGNVHFLCDCIDTVHLCPQLLNESL